MTINYGKRSPGGLTASDPGDTLYVPFSTYQDSGASVGIGGSLAISDLEIFKNGNATPRATDSGYSLISDTGQYGDRVGLHRFSISLFNNSADTGFFDEGSQYHVAIDSITVDGRTVRFFPAVFEIGTPRANIVEINGDTGAAPHIAALADEYDTGRLPAEATATLDTGGINQAVWQADASRTLTGWAFDTGVQQALNRLDTGLRDHIANHAVDTGLRDFIGDIDTGLRSHIDHTDTGLRAVVDNIDTGINETIDRILADTDTGLKANLAVTVSAISDTGLYSRLTSIDNAISAVDTGVNETIDRILADTDTGIQPPTAAQIAAAVWDDNDTGHGVNIRYVNEIEVGGTGDTGAASPWEPA